MKNRKTNPSVSIVIPTLNEEKYIGKTLRSIEKQTYPIRQIVVIDAASTDRTQRIAKQYSHVTVMNATPPVGNQRNKGLRVSRGDVTVFLDADVVMPHAFIEKAVAEMQKKQLIIACPTYTPLTRSIVIKYFYTGIMWFFKLGEKIFPSGAGACIFVQTAVAKQYRFDSTLTYEDIAFIRTVANHHPFGILNQSIGVSDRRFKKYGVLQTILLYVRLSVFFLQGKFKEANSIRYPFGNY